VPKGLPLETGQRALAVHVEDHPLDYATFEGEIPAGQYGAGSVEIWDRGTYELVEAKRDGGLTFRLHGDRLEGLWTLVPAKLDGDEDNWLVIKKRDEVERPHGRSDYQPMLATLETVLPQGDDWLYEIKWDGYRAIAYVRGSECRLRSRNGNDLTERFAAVAKAIPRSLKTPDAVLDGEVCALDERGRPSFSAMQQGKPETPTIYAAFDLLEVEGATLVDRPLEERRGRLEQLVDRASSVLRISEGFDDGPALAAAVEEQELEGVIAKRLGSPYSEGKRTRYWLKVKTRPEQEFLVAGYTRGEGRRSGGFGSLVLAVREGGRLRYVGNVGTGFSDAEIDRLLRLLKPLERPDPPFDAVPKMPRVRRGDVAWVEPKLVAQVEFSEWTHDGHLRAPSYRSLRDDKEPAEVRRELPRSDVAGSGKKTVRLTNQDKVFFPEDGITKGDLLAYYRAIAPVAVPHLRNRPFTMKRYPDGIDGGHFFQKDAPTHMPDWIPTYEHWASTRDAPRRRKKLRAPLVNDEPSLLWMINMGCIDLNTWYSRVDRPDRPDFVLFDLDPAADAGFRETVQVALLVKQALDALALESFPKTSGSDGIHVLVPVERRYTYDDTREFAEIVAGALAVTHRGLVTTEWTKAKRRGVLIDANQNGEGKTIAAAYSVRPHRGAPVSTPLRWEEVDERLDPRAFGMAEVLARVERDGDLYEPVLTTKQRIDRALDALRR
jgi:bifunctional non-homologous end joining protein LigD